MRSEPKMRIRSSRSDKKNPTARVALAAGAAAQLIVDAAALMPLRADHVEAAGLARLFIDGDLSADLRLLGVALRLSDSRRISSRVSHLQPHLDVAAELDVGAAAGHIGRDRDRAGMLASATI